MPECMDAAWMHVRMNANMVIRIGLSDQVGVGMDAFIDAVMAGLWL